MYEKIPLPDIPIAKCRAVMKHIQDMQIQIRSTYICIPTAVQLTLFIRRYRFSPIYTMYTVLRIQAQPIYHIP